MQKGNIPQPLWQIQAQAEIERRQRIEIERPSNDWNEWHTTLFPHKFTLEFGARHIEFFTFTDSIELGIAPDNAFFAVWPRGSGKTTVSESETVRLAALGRRRFILYVRSTQTKANESIQAISDMLEDDNFARIYPDLSSRRMSKYGHSKGYNATMLQTAADVTWLGLGFDAAVRGVKVGSLRPDLIVFDDIDDRTDTPLAIEKKTNVITNDILPAGSQDVAIIGIQYVGTQDVRISRHLYFEPRVVLLEERMSDPKC